MLESLDKMLLAGLGVLSLTRERAEKIFDEYVERGQAEKANRSKFVNDLVESAQKARKDLEDLVAKQVHQAVEKLNVATKDDVAGLQEKLDRLLKRHS